MDQTFKDAVETKTRTGTRYLNQRRVINKDGTPVEGKNGQWETIGGFCPKIEQAIYNHESILALFSGERTPSTLIETLLVHSFRQCKEAWARAGINYELRIVQREVTLVDHVLETAKPTWA